jgi:hypothetical protein
MYNLVSVELPNNKIVLKKIYSATYRQQNYEHDYAKIRFRDWNISPTSIRPGSLIKVTIDKKEFYGYVHDVKSMKDAQHDITEVGFIGASYVMRQASQKVYRNVTADQIVTEIAKKYNFSYKTSPHPRVYPQVSQAGMTDWEFMVKLAKQSGYFLRAENTALYFQPLLQDFNDLIYEAAAFDKADAGFKPLNPIYNFRPVIGETLAHQGSDKSATSIAGVNPETGAYFKYTKQTRQPSTRKISHPELFDKHATGVVANSYTTAIAEANSADDKSLFPYHATAEVYGKSTLRPGMPIYLGNVGQAYSGYWTILEVEHDIIEESVNLQKFTTHIAVGSDSLGELSNTDFPARPNPRGVRHIKPNVRNTRVKAGTALRVPGINIAPIKASQIVDRANRAKPKGKLLSTSTWSATESNLNSKPAEPRRSPAVMQKVMINRVSN